MNKKGFYLNVVLTVFCFVVLMVTLCVPGLNYRTLAALTLTVLIVIFASQAAVYGQNPDEEAYRPTESENENAGETEGSVDEPGREPGSDNNI